jgi:5-methylcytosine-specific restriction endonuclease McrA
MPRKLDLVNKRFGRWTVLNEFGKQNGHITWTCQCDCGAIHEVKGIHLKNRKSLSCGCYKKDETSRRLKLDLVDKKFGRLKVISEYGRTNDRRKRVIWLCVCDCGSKIKIVGDSLVSGNTKSCGCLRSEMKNEKHPRWKGGVKKGRNKLYNTSRYKEWRIKVYEKDNFTCQRCGDKLGHNLNAHHYKSWKKYPSSRYVVSNGISLCEKCHIWIHSSFNVLRDLIYQGKVTS